MEKLDVVDDQEVMGNQVGAAKVKREWIRDLQVMMRVSLDWPQEVPARALRMFSRGVAREMREAMWRKKVRWGSNVTPRIRGCSARGRN